MKIDFYLLNKKINILGMIWYQWNPSEYELHQKRDLKGSREKTERIFHEEKTKKYEKLDWKTSSIIVTGLEFTGYDHRTYNKQYYEYFMSSSSSRCTSPSLD